MATWSHFAASHGPVSQETSGNQQRFQTSQQVDPQLNFDHTRLDSTLLRSLSSTSLDAMSENASDSSVGCIPADACLEESFGGGTSEIPRRNLTEAFEELYIEPGTTSGVVHSSEVVVDSKNSKTVSPTGIAELVSEQECSPSEAILEHKLMAKPKSTSDEDCKDCFSEIPIFLLHGDLKRDLSQALVNRVSFYGVIHDINKEACAMAASDGSGYTQNQDEKYDPLVVAATVPHEHSTSARKHPVAKTALIDEEQWLLDAIRARGSDEFRSTNVCPPTFLQAIGERDYDNPLTSLSSGSRTQLWKPSRSWWEAKSGKNPWIEPKSHNRRWRYLWPLIHYHKFLARCIKKLKRNGVEVKTSVSPVAVFLREEVCAVSDHLAAVSLFDSDQWMTSLQHFEGWTNSGKKAELSLREFVVSQRLRPLTEPGDVDSPLLRSQIDEHFLRAMASARTQMIGTGSSGNRRKMDEETSPKEVIGNDFSKKGHPETVSTMPITDSEVLAFEGPPSCRMTRYASQSSEVLPSGVRRPRWGYPSVGGPWWGQGWNHQPAFPYGDDVSVHSTLSGESYSPHYELGGYPGIHHPPYYAQVMYPQHQIASGQSHLPWGYNQAVMDHALYPVGETFNAEQLAPSGWVGVAMPDPYMPHQISDSSGFCVTVPPGTPQSDPRRDFGAFEGKSTGDEFEQEGASYNYTAQVPMSPFWGHLDHATLALMAIASPQGNPAPQTPQRRSESELDHDVLSKEQSGISVNAQPLLLHQQYYGYGYGKREGYGPPSPATQFMMSPQANFAYSYGYGFSPRRPSSQRKRTIREPSLPEECIYRNNGAMEGRKPASRTVLKAVAVPKKYLGSPATIETTVESESLDDGN